MMIMIITVRYSSYGDEEEFSGVAEASTAAYSPDIVSPRPTAQRVSYELIFSL